jgi:hypothetical protein
VSWPESSGDVVLRPGRRLSQVAAVARLGVAQVLLGAHDLGRAELHRVVPDALGVVGLGQRGGEVVVLGGRGVGHRVEGRGVGELGLRAGGVAGLLVLLRGEGERGGDTADDVRGDLRARRGGLEHRPVRGRVLVLGAGVRVVHLRLAPQVVVAEVVRLVALADADLEVERLGRGVPHLVQVRGAVLRLGGQRGRGRRAERQVGGVEQVVGVRGGEGELEVVAGVEPAALRVDRARRRRPSSSPLIWSPVPPLLFAMKSGSW